MSVIFSFVYKYFFDALLVMTFGLFSKTLIKYFGDERAIKIKEIILDSMLWAEETFGIGSGPEKFKNAWDKILEMLKIKGITLKNKEISLVRDIIKSNVPLINSIVYSSLPETALMARTINTSSPSTKLLIDLLREKYPNSSPGDKNKLIKILKEKDEYINPKYQANKTKPIKDYREGKE